jgi:hypothetical protein
MHLLKNHFNINILNINLNIYNVKDESDIIINLNSSSSPDEDINIIAFETLKSWHPRCKRGREGGCW